MNKKNAIMNWSGGKDSSFALFKLLKNNDFQVYSLLTTLNNEYGRVSMHGVRDVLLNRQSESLKLPVVKVWLDDKPTMENYESTIQLVMSKLKSNGITHCVFGDIFLEDIRSYREEHCKKVGLTPVFPLWGLNTWDLAKEFIESGFKSIIVAVDGSKLSREFAGMIYDEAFLALLPTGVDPCGENGEFHTFVYDGPIFSIPIKFSIGEFIERSYPVLADGSKGDRSSGTNTFWFCDLLPERKGKNLKPQISNLKSQTSNLK